MALLLSQQTAASQSTLNNSLKKLALTQLNRPENGERRGMYHQTDHAFLLAKLRNQSPSIEECRAHRSP
jgi:hypothetical protein